MSLQNFNVKPLKFYHLAYLADYISDTKHIFILSDKYWSLYDVQRYIL